MTEEFGGARVHYPPGAFGQSNLGIAEQIVAHIRERIPAGAQVMEFYAGVGAIGLSLLGGIGRLTLNEVSPPSLFGLQLGLAELPEVLRAKVDVVPGAAESALHAAVGSQVVIVDPPRRGLDRQLSQFLATQPPEHLIYVSCGLASFVNDAGLLVAGGKMSLVELTAFNLMPFTEHVETVARFQRI